MLIMILTGKEIWFLKKHGLCLFATVSKKCEPHVTPVVYAMGGEIAVIAIDYGTKKFGNLKQSKKVSFVVDTCRPNAGVMIQGK